MMSSVKVFDEVVAWRGPINRGKRKPYCWIKIHGAGIRSEDYFALLDTGADYLMLPFDVKDNLKINMDGSTTVNISFASGTSKPLPRVSIDITIRGRRFNTYAVFGPCKTPLVGIRTIVYAMELGIDIDAWSYRSLAPTPRQRVRRLAALLGSLLRLKF
jgi:hypothetical protein